jgi:hypothetical protein
MRQRPSSNLRCERPVADVDDYPERALVKPHTDDDKGARACQAFGGAGFEITGLDKPLKEQLESSAAIGIHGVLPCLGGGGQLLGPKQPDPRLRIERHESNPAKPRVPQQEFGHRKVISSQGLNQHRAFPHRVGTPAFTTLPRTGSCSKTVHHLHRIRRFVFTL